MYIKPNSGPLVIIYLFWKITNICLFGKCEINDSPSKNRSA